MTLPLARFAPLSEPSDSRATRLTTVPVLAAVLTALALAVPAVSPILTSTVTLALVAVVAVVALQAFVGLTGVFSFGHVGFMAIGGYVTANLTIPVITKKILFPAMPMVEIQPALAVLIGAVVASVVALVFGVLLMRLSGLVASLGTFAFLNIAYNAALNLTDLTGGSTGVSNVPKVVTPVVALVCAIATIAVVWAYRRTRWGLWVQATRDDPIAAQAAGISVFAQRLIAFVLSGFLSGVAGGLYALSSSSFNPGSFFLVATLGYIAMLVVGGRLTVSGAVAGVLVITVVEELLRQVERAVALPGLQQVGFAVALVAMLIWRPLGLLGHHDFVIPLRRERTPVIGRPTRRRSDVRP